MTGVRLAFLVPAGYVALQRPFLGETLLAELAGVRPLTRVCAAMLVQARYIHTHKETTAQGVVTSYLSVRISALKFLKEIMGNKFHLATVYYISMVTLFFVIQLHKQR